MSKATKSAGGIMERFILAINAFKAKFGYWPTKIEAHEGTIVTLALGHLTPLGFFLLQSRVEIEVSTEFDIRLSGQGRDALVYGDEDCFELAQGRKHEARAWLGWDD
ncbi:hypothetical protein JZU69_04130 [bacterium]|nr:hypothetical protein [bacterium]